MSWEPTEDRGLVWVNEPELTIERLAEKIAVLKDRWEVSRDRSTAELEIRDSIIRELFEYLKLLEEKTSGLEDKLILHRDLKFKTTTDP